MKYARVIIISLVLALSSCVTTSIYSPKQAAPIAYKLFKGKPSNLMWIEGTNGILSSLLANAAVDVMGTEVQYVADLVEVVKTAKRKDVRISIAGTNSSFTAKIILTALENTSGQLPNLHLAFIGFREHEAEVRLAVEAKGGSFLFFDTKRS